MSYTQNP